MLKLASLIDMINSCNKCEACLDACPTYSATGNINFSPFVRLQTALRLYNKSELEAVQIESIYNCPECGHCKQVCPQSIDVPEVVAACRLELVKEGTAPLRKHQPVLSSITEKENSVNGNPLDRLNWLPEECKENIERKSETLFYAGCLPSYLVMDSARFSCLLLKRAGIDFTILRNEGCCGVYLYDAGMLNEARSIFEKNMHKFKILGVKRIVTPCAGCYRCFKRYYPEILGTSDFEVLHVAEYIFNLVNEGRLELNKIEEELVYHDSCRLGRKEGIYDLPRNLLKACGVKVLEFANNKENSMCCGAGAGIRSLYKDLSLKIGKAVLDNAPCENLVTSCPFCAFNLRYTAKKTESLNKVKYISEVVFNHLK